MGNEKLKREIRKKGWYVDTGSTFNIKRNFFDIESKAKKFVKKQTKLGNITGYRNIESDRDTQWKVWWMRGDSTGILQQRIFYNEIKAFKFVGEKKKQGLLTGIHRQQKGMM